MANLKSSKKDAIVSKKRRLLNMSKRSMIRTFIKKVRIAIFSKKKEKIIFSFRKMQSIVDKYSKKGLIHKNKAARLKSRINNKIKKIFGETKVLNKLK
ncbi:30S ribosomal protein S20 [Buchnera aphidicola (Mindarus keteleerifoliae)]|uniref:30S ribosomal protein S20 n=1 Tax=Buchnera aphidicola TaxID=9 RepID=UPI0031B69676